MIASLSQEDNNILDIVDNNNILVMAANNNNTQAILKAASQVTNIKVELKATLHKGFKLTMVLLLKYMEDTNLHKAVSQMAQAHIAIPTSNSTLIHQAISLLHKTVSNLSI